MPDQPKMEPMQISHEGSSFNKKPNNDLNQKSKMKKDLVEIFNLVMKKKLTKDFDRVSITNLRCFLKRLSKMERLVHLEYDRKIRSMLKKIKKQKRVTENKYNLFGIMRNAK